MLSDLTEVDFSNRVYDFFLSDTYDLVEHDTVISGNFFAAGNLLIHT